MASLARAATAARALRGAAGLARRAAVSHARRGAWVTVRRAAARPAAAFSARRALSGAAPPSTPLLDGASSFSAEALARVRVPDEEQAAILERGVPMERIRNLSVIAHIDHGKSTLSDRFLEAAGNITARERERGQVLDSLQAEAERGITISATTASVWYRHGADGEAYLLNLIDTPGHVDFSYEVSRSLAACEGALLLVDATQGVQAQTIANHAIAVENGLALVPVLTKLDMPNADVDSVLEQIESAFGIPPEEAVMCSAKTGEGVLDVLAAAVERMEPPRPRAPGDEAVPPASVEDPAQFVRARVVDQWYNVHRGVICLVQMADGELKAGDKILAHHAGGTYEVQEVGLMRPQQVRTDRLRCGQVGYVIANIKSPAEVRLGDTFVRVAGLKSRGAVEQARADAPALPGFEPAKSFVFAGLFPSVKSDFDALRSAVDKLLLNDPSVSVRTEHSDALGMGLSCGFLGMLHLEVFSQRLEQEFGASVIQTTPTVTYRLELADGTVEMIDTPSKFPDPKPQGSRLLEPIILAKIMCREQDVGAILDMVSNKRGTQKDVTYLGDRVLLVYELPLSEILQSFFTDLQSLSSGYASFDYTEAGWAEARLNRMDVMINGEVVDPLSFIAPFERQYDEARGMLDRLAANVRRQNFELNLQVAAGRKVIASEKVKPFRKDVLTTKASKKVGGGDPTRKMKVLEKQKRGKKRMKEQGSVKLGSQAFLSILQNK